jgi:hypothetical protein
MSVHIPNPKSCSHKSLRAKIQGQLTHVKTIIHIYAHRYLSLRFYDNSRGACIGPEENDPKKSRHECLSKLGGQLGAAVNMLTAHTLHKKPPIGTPLSIAAKSHT